MVQICWTIAHVFICIAQLSHEVKSYQDALHVQWNQIWGAIREFLPPSLGKPECFAVQKSLSQAMVKQTWGWGILVEAPHGVHWYLDWIYSHRVVWVDPWSEWTQKRRGRAAGERPGTSVSGGVAIIMPWVENDVGSRKGSAQLPVGIQ